MEAVTAAAIQAGARRKGPRSTLGCTLRAVSHAPWFGVNCSAARCSHWSARRCASTAARFRYEERRSKSLARCKWRRWQIQRQRQHIGDLKLNTWAVFQDLAGTHSALPPDLGSTDRWVPFQLRPSIHQAAAAGQLPEKLQPPSFCQEASERLNGAAITVSECFRP